MDPITAEKLRAMKSYKKSQFYKLLFHCLVALTCSLLCSFPFSFASLSSSIMFLSLPTVWSSFFNPKCLFVVVNVIVVFLVGESKLLGSSHSSPATDIYSEYIERSQSLKGQRQPDILQEKKEDSNLKSEYHSIKEVERIKEVEAKEDELDKFEDCEEDDDDENYNSDEHHQQQRDGEDENNNADDHDQQQGDGEDEVGLPAEELNKRVEDFIARVNKQRWLEELVYSTTKAYN